MELRNSFQRCQNEPTVSDFESHLSYCIFQRKGAPDECTLEMYSYIRDRAFEKEMNRPLGSLRARFGGRLERRGVGGSPSVTIRG